MTKLDLFVMSPGIIGLILLAFFSCFGPGEGQEVPPSEIEPVAVMEAAEKEPEDTPSMTETLWEDVPLTAELQEIFKILCDQNNIPYHLALGLIETESSFDPDADNGLCYGLMQLNRDYFPDGLSPEENIQYGIEYLAYQMERYDTVEAALTAYNAGHDTGSRSYANKVLEKAEAWREVIAQCTSTPSPQE